MQLFDNVHFVVVNVKITIQSMKNILLYISILDCRDGIDRTIHQITFNSLDEQIWKLTKKRKRLLDKLKTNIKIKKFLKSSDTKHIQEI
jgi:hypothetical protein